MRASGRCRLPVGTGFPVSQKWSFALSTLTLGLLHQWLLAFSAPLAAAAKNSDKCASYYDAVEKNMLGSTTFLAITSTTGKVLYTQVVSNSLASDGRALALVDSGLTTPKDIVYDPKAARIFVSDFEGKRIISYKIFVHVDEKLKKHLRIRGDRIVVAEDVKSEYLALDHEGNLYFTTGDSVNKISNALLKQLYAGTLRAKDLKTQSEVSAFYAAQEELQKNSGVPLPPAVAPPQIVEVATGLSQATGLITNGEQIYWGQSNPVNNSAEVVAVPVIADAPNPTKTKVAYTVNPKIEGVAMNYNSIFFAAAGTVLRVPQSNNMNLPPSSAAATTLATGLVSPRGLAWDHDGTLYIADGGASQSSATGAMLSGLVYSVPSGAPGLADVQEVVAADGAFGVAVVSCSDEGIEVIQETTETATSTSRMFFWTLCGVSGVLLTIGLVVLRF
ncbi:unnamed protein product [Amoebophrya sp. A25]|nr:unnamed protein product [Amoebophrya sp. A25]|eukprot:GSA25T00004392001.1